MPQQTAARWSVGSVAATAVSICVLLAHASCARPTADIASTAVDVSTSLAPASPGAVGRALLGDGKSYQSHEKVPLYANKVGPFHNPTETYQYYDYPFCQPEEGKVFKPEDLGEVIGGNRLVNTPYDLSFMRDYPNEPLCGKTLTADELQKFRRAVKDDFYFQMYYDDLPIWGFIGKVEKIMKPGDTELRFYLFTHVHFDISYNEDKVIEINVSTDPLRTVDITEGDSMSVQFSYSATVRARPMPPGVDGPDVSLSSGMRCAVETYYYSIRPAHGEILQILLLATAPGDPLVLYHQLLRYRASVDGFPCDHLDASAQERLCQIHARR